MANIASRRGAPLLERENEVALLAELVGRAADGGGGTAAVVGPAGIGKTSLLDAARSEAEDHGLSCHAARGGELERDFAYGVVRQLLERPVRQLSAARRRAVFEGAAAQAAPVLGLESGADREHSDSPFAVVHALYWACANLSARKPLVLLVDDLHWADAASLRFLAYLVRRAEELPLAVLAAARPPLRDERTELLEAVTTAREVQTVEPSALSEEAVREIVEAELGRAPELDLAIECWRATGGNPLLCKALASSLADETLEGRDVTEIAGKGVSQLVLASIGRLPEDAAALARAVAILGTNADLRQAASMAELGERDAAAAADVLAAQGILAVGRPLEFVHPLVRTAVAERIPPAERLLAHARAARVVHGTDASSDAVATHLLAAEPAGDRWAAEQLLAAARSALARGAPEPALSYLRRALREPPPAGMRAELLRELGATEIQFGEERHAIEHLEEGRALTEEVVARAQVARVLAAAFSLTGRFERSVEVLERALEELGGSERDLELELEGQRLAYLYLAPGGAGAGPVGHEPAESELQGRTRGERAYLAALIIGGLLAFDRPDLVPGRARRAIEGGLFGDVVDAGVVWHNVLYPLTFLDGYALVRRATAEALEYARRRGSAPGVSRAYAQRATLHLREGALREAAADARTAVETGREIGLASSMIALGALVETLAARGRYEHANAVLVEADLADEIPLHFHWNWVLHGRAWLRLAEGRREDAIADFRELDRRGQQWRPWNPAMFPYRSGLAMALLAGGDRSQARALASEELELARRSLAPRAIGISVRALGLCEGSERGLELLRESVETLDGSGARLEHARSLVDLGAAIRRSGKRTEAREPLHAGMELAHACGAEPLVERARDELCATGARPRRIVRTGVDALTPSELRVAKMAADGMSNPEIAQALFVTLRTVEVHLTHAYRKLDISSREQLGDALAGAD